MFRSHLGCWSAAFLKANPKHSVTKYENAAFLLLLRKRFLDKIPCMEAIKNAKCTCGAKKANEEHAFKCPKDGGRAHRHKALQMAVMAMLKHAGIVTSTEDTNLVQGNGQRR